MEAEEVEAEAEEAEEQPPYEWASSSPQPLAELQHPQGVA